jgi:hypothetical protein
MLFYKDISTYFDATCRECGVKTDYNNYVRYRLEDRVSIGIEFQCEDCGGLTLINDRYTRDFNLVADAVCSCGGKLRRDNPLICSACKVVYSSNSGL